MERLNFLYPMITLTLIVILWAAAIKAFAIPSYLLPSRAAVLSALKRGYVDGLFWKDFLFTMRSTSIGYCLGCVAAFLAAMPFAQVPAVERFVYPYLVALQSMPKVALAPLILVWCGFGLASKVVHGRAGVLLSGLRQHAERTAPGKSSFARLDARVFGISGHNLLESSRANGCNAYLLRPADCGRTTQRDQRSTSRVEVMRTHVQPVSLHTRLSPVPGSARL